jgi:hypothetical protein
MATQVYMVIENVAVYAFAAMTLFAIGCYLKTR